MYELISVMAGIRRESGKPDFVEICPHMDYVPDLKGMVHTEFGDIAFSYMPDGDDMRYEVTLPEGMNGRFLTTGGKAYELRTGSNVIL